MNDQEFKAELMKRTKDVLADRIIELTRICDKEYMRANQAEVKYFYRINLLVNNAQQAAYWLLDCHPDSAPRLLGEQLQAAINFDDSIPAKQNKNNPGPTATD